MQDHKKFLDDYRSVLDPTWHPPAVAVPGGLLTSSPNGGAGREGAGHGPAKLRPCCGGIEAQADVRNPILGPPELPDVNAQALGQTRPTPALPKLSQQEWRRAAPSFDAPRRAFR